MKKLLLLSLLPLSLSAQDKPIQETNEKSVSKAQYFSWINNTNEGATEEHTLVNLDFFEWLQKEYGMILDIYAFDAGLIDGAKFYGSTQSDRFKRAFPNGLDKVYQKAKAMKTRFGVWGGPDGFGNTPEQAENRKKEFEALCRDYEWALFKFDRVCGPLPEQKQDDFIDLMKRCRTYSPDLILLNHRLGLGKGEPYATTFLWEGQETYIDIHSFNTETAPHNRAASMKRGLVPGMQRLTEDHGVCLSSCLDYWDDELVIQAFNRSLILAPEIYGNPWLLADHEFPKLARIYNLHRKFGEILVNGFQLPEKYGESAVSRGDKRTRVLTLRNMSWQEKEVEIKLDEEIGLTAGSKVKVRQYHPSERMLGEYKRGESVKVKVLPFRSALIVASTTHKYDEPEVYGCDFEVVRNVKGKDTQIKLLGMPGTTAQVKLPDGTQKEVTFPGKKLNQPYHRFLGTLQQTPVTDECETLYEATVFSADNNALEVRSLHRSGPTAIPQVQAARDAFFNQSAFKNRGVWDKNLFDGDMNTGFFPNRRKMEDQRINGGCFRLDLGEVMHVDSIVMRMKDEFCMTPLLIDEGVYTTISTDLKNWKRLTFISRPTSTIAINEQMRYLRMTEFPEGLFEVEVYSHGKQVPADKFRASNLFAAPANKPCVAMWKKSITLNEIAKGSYLCVALEGTHGDEGAYASVKVGDKYIGASRRSVSYISNTWENKSARSDANYTYYIPLDESMVNQPIEVYVMGYEKEKLSFKPNLWITAYPTPFEEIKLY